VLFCAAALTAIHLRESHMTPLGLGLLASGPVAFLILRAILRPHRNGAAAETTSARAASISRGTD
jgi:hypothetical protein